jgi:hypothetical protein
VVEVPGPEGRRGWGPIPDLLRWARGQRPRKDYRRCVDRRFDAAPLMHISAQVFNVPTLSLFLARRGFGLKIAAPVSIELRA